MAQFKYTLPSGAKFTMNAPDGTTQAQADKIFYEQVAAGTFVGYNKGDTLTHPQQALQNFGITRLERGTAGVDDQTLLSIISGLPTVAPVPTLSSVSVDNPITQANYIQVNSNPVDGLVDQGPTAVGDLTAVQTQAVMAQVSNVVGQAANVITQEYGIGKYGFNSQQLERAGYIKPGYSQMYCPLNANTQANPDNFVEFMYSPTPWTGQDNVYTVTDILNNEALQNKIQNTLMSQSYDTLVATGVIVPSISTQSVPSITTGKIYHEDGTVGSANVVSILTAPIVPSTTTLGDKMPLGSIPPEIQAYGETASATYAAGLSSLTNGAVNLTPGVSGLGSQLSGLSSVLNSNTALLAAGITSTLKGDVGALVANASKFGPNLTSLWAGGSDSLTRLSGTAMGSLSNISNMATAGLNNAGNLAQGALTNASGMLSTAQGTLTNAAGTLNNISASALDKLGKASQLGVNFSDFNLSGLVARVIPAGAFTNTVDRKTVDAAVTRVIGSEKISSPQFELPSVQSLGVQADMDKARSELSQLKNTQRPDIVTSSLNDAYARYKAGVPSGTVYTTASGRIV